MKFTFIHIPRCAGHSLRRVFRTSDNYVKCHKKSSHTIIKNYNFDSVYTVSCVRNIWDSLASTYNYLRNSSDAHRDYKKLAKRMNFTDWIIYHKKNKVSKYSLSPSDYLIRDGKLITDFIIRFDKFQEDWNILKGILCLSRKPKKLNKNKHTHYSEYYNKKTIKIVNQVYRKDIKKFGMKFELGNVDLGGKL